MANHGGPADFSSGLCQRRFIAPTQDNFGTVLDEPQGDRPLYASASAGDNNDLPLKVSCRVIQREVGSSASTW